MIRVYLTVALPGDRWFQFRGDGRTMADAYRCAVKEARTSDGGVTPEHLVTLENLYQKARADVAGRKDVPCTSAVGISHGQAYCVAEIFRR